VVSIVTPAYNEADNLELLYERLKQVLTTLGINWEWVIVDDRSTDDTFKVAARLAKTDEHVRAVRLARNSGSHVAMYCGLDMSSGQCAVVMASDLQDPPETIPVLLAQWHAGAKVVWAVRSKREGERATTIGFSRLYYLVLRRVVGLSETPASGADFFLVDRVVVQALRRFDERNVSLLALISWLGFRQTYIAYVKQSRQFGRSGWTLDKKLRLVIDSVTAFTHLPIRLMSYAGLLVGLAGFLYALVVIANSLFGAPVEGWSSMMVVVLVLGGSQMVMLGVLGEYLWRTLEEARKRPRYVIDEVTEKPIRTHLPEINQE
jgi:glycosyltransferase involved in cell wall biosynthesis